MKERLFYIEFNPRDWINFQHLLDRTIPDIKERFGADAIYNPWEFSVGRVANNAELHFFKMEVWSRIDKLEDKIKEENASKNP